MQYKEKKIIIIRAKQGGLGGSCCYFNLEAMWQPSDSCKSLPCIKTQDRGPGQLGSGRFLNDALPASPRIRWAVVC